MVGTTPSRVAFVAATTGVDRWEFVPTGGAPRVPTGRAPAGQVVLHGVTSLDTRLQPRVCDHSPMMPELASSRRRRRLEARGLLDGCCKQGHAHRRRGRRHALSVRDVPLACAWRNAQRFGHRHVMKAPLAEPLQHVADTDVWYRTFRIPAGARFSYFLSPNSPWSSMALTLCSSLRRCRPTRSTPIAGGCAPLVPISTSVSPEPNFLAQRRSRGFRAGRSIKGYVRTPSDYEPKLGRSAWGVGLRFERSHVRP